MKKIIKFLCAVLVVVMLLCNIPSFAAEQEIVLTIGSTNISAGDSGRITLTAEKLGDFIGGYNFEIIFPKTVQITDVYCGETKLVSLADGGSDYNIRSNNTLVLAGTCNYGNEITLGNTVYYIDFNTSASITSGKHLVKFTENTYIVSDSDDEKLIFPSAVNGAITVNGPKADIDGSGNADTADIAIFKKWLIGSVSEEDFNVAAADINKDGILDIRDLVALKKYFSRVVVYLSDNGDDGNEGDSADRPFATLNHAIEQVYEGGTVYITDNYTIDSEFIWKNHLKSVEISGGILDATNISSFKIADDTIFNDITLNFKSGTEIFANGFELEIGENVVLSGKPYLYGGGTSEVESTSLKIHSGTYQYIYGGGKNANVVGDTNVVIDGNVNNEIDETDHDGGIYIVGGCENGVVGGNTNVTVGGSAKATYIIGAGIGANSKVSGKTKVQIDGGAFMSAYAGSTNGKCSNTELTFSGGTIEQIFGGNESASLTGDTYLKILGGTVTRRIYGGCYNNLTNSGSWTSQYHVSGNTTVFLSSNANIKFGSLNDRGIFACSRYESHFDDENSAVIFEDSAAYTKFKSSLGQQDFLSKLISSWPEAAKTITTLE